jgi:hypothetical protein
MKAHRLAIKGFTIHWDGFFVRAMANGRGILVVNLAFELGRRFFFEIGKFTLCYDGRDS